MCSGTREKPKNDSGSSAEIPQNIVRRLFGQNSFQVLKNYSLSRSVFGTRRDRFRGFLNNSLLFYPEIEVLGFLEVVSLCGTLC